LGFWLVAGFLLPLYYRLNLISIYSFLNERLGFYSYKTGSFFFLISKLIGASFRLYLVAGVLQIAFFDSVNIPFSVTVIVTILLVWAYTFRGGVKTIVWTDSLQTVFLLTAVVLTILNISNKLNWSVAEMVSNIRNSDYSTVFITDWRSGTHFLKQILSGMFITIVMVGMDQDMMQKNLTCKNQKEAQKNMFVFSFAFVGAVLLFLSLGALLYLFAAKTGIQTTAKTDDFYPMLALNHLGVVAAVAFLIGITAAAYSSADSALTALTTSFCIDFLNIERFTEEKRKRLKWFAHIGFSVMLIVIILIFKAINNESVVVAVFKVAGYTYGPILGLFLFAMFSKRQVKDRFVPALALTSPVLTWMLSIYSEELFFGYKFGFELLIINGSLMLAGLFLFSRKSNK
jgi:Na+/proline symporter